MINTAENCWIRQVWHKIEFQRKFQEIKQVQDRFMFSHSSIEEIRFS